MPHVKPAVCCSLSCSRIVRHAPQIASAPAAMPALAVGQSERVNWTPPSATHPPLAAPVFHTTQSCSPNCQAPLVPPADGFAFAVAPHPVCWQQILGRGTTRIHCSSQQFTPSGKYHKRGKTGSFAAQRCHSGCSSVASAGQMVQ